MIEQQKLENKIAIMKDLYQRGNFDKDIISKMIERYQKDLKEVSTINQIRSKVPA